MAFLWHVHRQFACCCRNENFKIQSKTTKSNYSFQSGKLITQIFNLPTKRKEKREREREREKERERQREKLDLFHKRCLQQGFYLHLFWQLRKLDHNNGQCREYWSLVQETYVCNDCVVVETSGRTCSALNVFTGYCCILSDQPIHLKCNSVVLKKTHSPSFFILFIHPVICPNRIFKQL